MEEMIKQKRVVVASWLELVNQLDFMDDDEDDDDSDSGVVNDMIQLLKMK